MMTLRVLIKSAIGLSLLAGSVLTGTLPIITPASVANAADIIKVRKPHSSKDRRNTYPLAVLTAALEATRGDFGEYEIQRTVQGLSRARELRELTSGKNLNVVSAPSKPAWEEKALPVRIPIRKGLLGYRLLLVKKDNLPMIASVKSVDDLKGLRVGSGSQWSTTRTLKSQNFNLVTGSVYEKLFEMLDQGRFDYFPRGVNEVFTEFEARKDLYPDMVIAPGIAMYMPLPTYFFVSPNDKPIADRIEAGLRRMIDDGQLNELFEEHLAPYTEQAKLETRVIYRIENPLLSPETPLDDPKLWYMPKEMVTKNRTR